MVAFLNRERSWKAYYALLNSRKKFIHSFIEKKNFKPHFLFFKAGFAYFSDKGTVHSWTDFSFLCRNLETESFVL